MRTNKDERMEIKRMLWAWGSALDDCKRRREEIKDLMLQVQDADDILRSQTFDAMPKGTDIGDPTGRALKMKEDSLRRVDQLEGEINKLMEMKAQMDAIIATLPERLREIVELRYMRSWRPTVEIPRKKHLATSTVYEWLDDAYEKIRENENFGNFRKLFVVQ